MTEAEWPACADPNLMVAHLTEGTGLGISERKARLFGCCIRHRVWPLLCDERSRSALDVSERFADGLATADELVASKQNAFAAAAALSDSLGGEDDRYQAAAGILWAVAFTPAQNLRAGLRSADPEGVCGFLRDVFGNPFRPVSLDSSWLTSTVRTLAERIYADRAFDRLPILADALQDAGCENSDVLDHCRGPGPHVRGCWVVDLFLGKA
jgi:hypothetical protein